MVSFVTAYLIVWAFVAVYVFRLRNAQQGLSRRIRTLETLLGDRDEEKAPSRAA